MADGNQGPIVVVSREYESLRRALEKRHQKYCDRTKYYLPSMVTLLFNVDAVFWHFWCRSRTMCEQIRVAFHVMGWSSRLNLGTLKHWKKCMHPAESRTYVECLSVGDYCEEKIGLWQRTVSRPTWSPPPPDHTDHMLLHSRLTQQVISLCARWEFRSHAAAGQPRGVHQTGKAAQRRNRLAS